MVAGLTALPAAAQQVSPGALQAAIGNPLALHLSGSFRVRTEFLDDQVRPGFRPDEDLLALRTTLRADVGDGPVHAVVELWDSRAYTVRDHSAVSTGEVNTFEPVQAYVAADFGDALGAGSRTQLTLGRMMINLGSRRLVAADDFRNTTNGYTGVRLDFAPGKALSATLIATLPQQRRPDDFASLSSNRQALDHEGFDLTLWGGVATWHPGPARAELSFYAVAERDTPDRATRDRHLSTADVRLVRDAAPGGFDSDLEAAWQWGNQSASLLPTAPGQAVAAWFAHAAAGYTAKNGVHARLSVEFDYVSGDHPGGRYTRFDTLFGMRRADFSVGSILSAIGRANILAPALRLSVLPDRATDGHVSVRAMWAASATDSFSTTNVRDITGAAGRFAGYELDSRVRHWLVADVLRAEWNGTLLLREGLLRHAPNAPPGATTFYAALSLVTMF